MFGSNLYSASVSTGPLRGGHDADVALGEDECDARVIMKSRRHVFDDSLLVKSSQIFWSEDHGSTFNTCHMLLAQKMSV